MILSWAALAYGSAPTIEARWGPDGVVVSARAPADQKIAADAPSRLTLAAGDATWSAEAVGPPTVAAPFDARGERVSGIVELGLCDLDGAACTPGRWAYAGEIGDQRRGLAVFPVSAEGEEVFGPDATAEAADAAFARARENGRAVLLDFSAVWCPPCNLLAAEVLHGPPTPELDLYEVVVLDVDHPSSFTLKDRYDVGGYPTLVVTDAEGTERSRHLGYTTREELLGWLAGAAQSTDALDLQKDPATVPPARAAQLGLALMDAGDDERAAIWLARAEEDPAADAVSTRLLRFLVAPTAGDLDWLLAHAPERAPAYAGAAIDVGGPGARRAVALELLQAEGPALAVALDHAAQVGPESERATYYAAAAAALRGALTGDRARDKGFVTDLAWLLVRAGDADAAVALLQQWSAASPGDPTFDLSLATRLIELERYEEAVAAADRALAVAWGDNALRCAAAKSEALLALGRIDEAKAVARGALAAQPPPSVDVRTHRYRTALEALAAGRAP